MKKLILAAVLIYTSCTISFAQIGIGTIPDSSAQLDVSSSNRGFLIPRLNAAQRNAIANPVTGLQIFNTTTNCLELYVNGLWQRISCGCITPPCSAPNGAAYVSTTNQIIWNWNAVAGATGYKYNTVNNLATAINNFDCLTFTQTGVACSGADQILYVWAYNACGNSPVASTAVRFEQSLAGFDDEDLIP